VTGTIELQATNDITVSAAWNLATSTSNSNVSVVLRAGNDININAAITLDGTGTLTLEADGNTADGTGNVNIAAAGSLTSSRDINITAADLVITSGGTINSSTLGMTILSSTGGTIGLGDTSCGGTCSMSISGAELESMTVSSGDLVIGATTGGNVFVDNITSANSANISNRVTLNTAGSVTFESNASVFSSILDINADGDITFNANVTFGGTGSNVIADVDTSGAGDFMWRTGLLLRMFLETLVSQPMTSI